MQNRIKQIRKAEKLNQEEFGKRIGAKQSTITAYECGNRVPMDVTITAICNRFGVNEDWLRTGSGEMYKPKNRIDEISEIVDAALPLEPEAAKKSLAARLARLTDGEAILLAAILDRRFPDTK